VTSNASQVLEKEFRAGAIWAHVYRADKSTAKYPQYDVRIQRHWNDTRSGKWRTTTYFRPEDLPRLILVASKAYEYIMLHEMDSNSDSSGDAPDTQSMAETANVR
jgi:hypothetical protein